ncbi:telomere length regulation protein-domain-containing protein [Mycena amicta]|nr:telomere length regulation protein-domain-containing protein [Mycena amicta]
MQAEEIIAQLQTQISDPDTLLRLLAPPLACISLLPPQFVRYNVHPLPHTAVNISRHIPSFQREILRHIGPTWEPALAEKGLAALLDQYLCPDIFSFASPTAGEVTLLAYSTIMSLPFTEYSLRALVRLSERYPIDRLYVAVFARDGQDAKRMRRWEDCVRNIAAIPSRVSNALRGDGVPPSLEHGPYFSNICKRTECAIAALSASPAEHESWALAYLLTKLVNVGVFPSSPPSSPAQASFFAATIPRIRVRLSESNSSAYTAAWVAVLRGIPSALTLQSILTSLFSSLRADSGTACSTRDRAAIKRESHLLLGVLGGPDSEDLWESSLTAIISREWTEAHARIYVCWISAFGDNGKALERLLDAVVEIWASPDHVKHSLLSRHHCTYSAFPPNQTLIIFTDITSLLLITLSYLPPSSPHLPSLALSPPLISGVGRYIAVLDESVRRCGMLVAEVVARLSGKKLDFGDWDGDTVGKAWARQIRELLSARDVDAIEETEASSTTEDFLGQSTTPVQAEETAPNAGASDTGYDSDDSLSGYISQSSSRSPSPTPSELAEIEKDPTLGVGVKKVPRPVYLAQLGALLRPTAGLNVDEARQASEMEMAINCAEELIRRKKGYGTELEENAVNLVYGLVGAQNNYEIEDFGMKRQAALTAMVYCVPRIAAPCIVEEFFKNQYSTDQRFAMLNALALGARELASLSVPKSSIPLNRIAFPSKTLPLRLHQKYVAEASLSGPLPGLLEDISREALDREVESTVDRAPELVRERKLRVQNGAPLQEIHRQRTTQSALPNNTTFTEVAAQYFIGPLVNHFWLFFRDEQNREQRTLHLEGRQRYHGAGTGLVLNPIVMAHFLATLAILTHAARNSPEWLAVIAPDSLELAVTLGTKPISHEDDPDDPNQPESKEASVLCTALELALVVLDGSLELDGGRALGLDHTPLLFGTGEWAGAVFSKLEKGLLVQVKLKRAAAGVLLKVDSLTSRWRRSMIDTM